MARLAPRRPELMEELVEEVLLRFPPDDPASLARAALVCKLWCRLVSGTAFRRRFREFHRSRGPPLLGMLYTGSCWRLRHGDDDTHRPEDSVDDDPSAVKVKPDDDVVNKPVVSAGYFVPTTSFRRSAPAADGGGRSGWSAVDARHGRVLLCYRSHSCPEWPGFSVWDPVTDELRDLPMLPYKFVTRHRRWSAAVACAAATAAGGNRDCDGHHLDCHRGPFLVVVMVTKPGESRCLCLAVYSSESGTWSRRRQLPDLAINLPGGFLSRVVQTAPTVLVGTAFYFLVQTYDDGIVKYDLVTGEVSEIHMPSEFHHLLRQRSVVLMTDDDGGLGMGFVTNDTDYQLELWSVTAAAGFVRRRVIDLVRLFPCRALINKSPQVSGFAEVGASSRFLFMRTPDGLYSLEINSSQVKKVANCCDNDKLVLPYVSFCTPTSPAGRV